MNLKQAQYLKTIAASGSITQAARALYVSQPSLSKMLLQLEADAGLPLFHRNTSPLQPTFAGERYLQAAEKILSAQALLEQQLREIRQERQGRLRLGISVQRAMQVLPLVMPAFCRQYPEVYLELTEDGSANLEAQLHRGEIDLALAAMESTSPDLSYVLLERETIGILAGAASHLAQNTPPGQAISLQDAQADSFVILRPGHSLRVVQDQLFRQQGFRPGILLQTDSLEVGRRTVLAAGACMLLSNIFVDEFVRQQGGVFYPLAGYENHRHFYGCSRRDGFLPSYAQDFLQITAQALAREQAENGLPPLRPQDGATSSPV